jgi:hypothetical protein
VPFTFLDTKTNTIQGVMVDVRRFIVPAPVPGGFMMPPRNFIDMNIRA